MDYLIYGLVFILGSMIGSFLNVLIYRMPLGESVILPQSKCPSCGNELMWYHNIPIISWVVLDGECAYCDAKISWQYPLVEFGTGLLYMAVAWSVGFVWWLPFTALSLSLLFAIAIIDYKTQMVPESVLIVLFFIGMIHPGIINSLIAVVSCSFLLWGVKVISSRISGEESMGDGDIIVAGIMGGVLGLPMALYTLMMAAVLLIIVGVLYREERMSFVPFLFLASFIMIVFQNEITAYMNHFLAPVFFDIM